MYIFLFTVSIPFNYTSDIWELSEVTNVQVFHEVPLVLIRAKLLCIDQKYTALYTS